MKNFKDIIIPLAIKAGNEIMRYYAKQYTINTKSDNSPVTDADISANKIITGELKKTHLPVISEESPITDYNERKKWEKFWLIDPLDGTRQFVNNEIEFTVNIALISDNKAIEGVVYVPVTKTLYYGNLKEGAIKIDINSSSTYEFKLPLNNAEKFTVVASKSHLNKKTITLLKQMELSNRDMKILNIGSSLKFCCIAEGVADIYPRIGSISEWDIAAGHAIVKSAGGNIIDLNTHKEVLYNTESLETPDFVCYREEEKLKEAFPDLEIN